MTSGNQQKRTSNSMFNFALGHLTELGREFNLRTDRNSTIVYYVILQNSYLKELKRPTS